MGNYRSKCAALALLAALPLAAAAADDPPRDRNGTTAGSKAKKPACVPDDADRAPKANPCPPGYMPAPGSKVPPLGSTDIGGAGAPGAADGKGGTEGAKPGNGSGGPGGSR